MDRDDICLCLCALHCMSPVSVQGLVPAYIAPSQIYKVFPWTWTSCLCFVSTSLLYKINMTAGSCYPAEQLD